MTYIIKIEDEDQLNFLKRVVENLYIKMHSNTSGYVEYLDIIDALKSILIMPQLKKIK